MLIVTVPLVTVVEVTIIASPSISVSLASTSIVTAISSLVVTMSLTANGAELTINSIGVAIPLKAAEKPEKARYPSDSLKYYHCQNLM